jgi:hypothetical protein
MKNMRAINIFVFSILTILLFAGCFSPLSIEPPKQESPAADSFTIDVLIGQGAKTARSVAGPDQSRIRGDIRNIIQLMVVNDSGRIVAFDEVRRGSDAENDAVLEIDSIPFNQTYHFLLLMGHWERDYTAEAAANNGKYTYKEADSPTLLAVGMENALITGSGIVTITMWPLVVDTVFTTTDSDVPPALRTAEATVNSGKPETVSLLPVDWGVTWTARQGTSGNGFVNLIQAQKVIDKNAGDALLLKSQKTIARGSGLTDTESTAAVNGNTINLGIGSYTSGLKRVGTGGSANFRLEYIPFNLTGGNTNPWVAFDVQSVFDLSGNKEPVWIIRNGVNDLGQDANTDFENLGKPGQEKVNGNGAVSFTIKAGSPGTPEKPNPDGEYLLIKDGVFMGPPDITTPDIKFTTAGYANEAEAYYAVVPQKTNAPSYSDYNRLDAVTAGNHRKTITLPGPGTNGYDIYVVIMKSGAVSEPVIINTLADIDVDWIWGEPEDGDVDVDWIWG